MEHGGNADTIDTDTAVAAIDAAIAKADDVMRMAIELDHLALSDGVRELQQALADARSRSFAVARHVGELQTQLVQLDQVVDRAGIGEAGRRTDRTSGAAA